MIDRLIPVQTTQQENHSNAKYYHKKTLKAFHRLIIVKNPKQKLNQSVNYHHLTKTETSSRRQLDLTIESMQQSIETHAI